MSYRPLLVAAVGLLQTAYRERQACLRYEPRNSQFSPTDLSEAVLHHLGAPFGNGDGMRDRLELAFCDGTASEFLDALDKAQRLHAEGDLNNN